jgi:Predicted integral membrane protein
MVRKLVSGFSKPISRIAAVLFLAGSGLAFATGAAHADFRVCNGTQSLVGGAIGYRTAEGWVTEGWWQIPANSCATLIEGPLQSRYYYLYAEDASGGGRWAGNINMCVADNEFKITGVEDCFARGFQRAGFKEYDTGRQRSWMVQLSDAPAAPSESQN